MCSDVAKMKFFLIFEQVNTSKSVFYYLSITAPKTSAFRQVIKARKLSVTQEYFDFQYIA